MTVTLDDVRSIADTVLYEGYLLYPYRASSNKNQVRWQWGVLGPPAAAAGVGEPPEMKVECLVETSSANIASVTAHLRFLQLQRRQVERSCPDGFEPVDELLLADGAWVTWDEAVPQEITLGPIAVREEPPQTIPVDVPGWYDAEPLVSDGAACGRLVRTREPLRAEVRGEVERAGFGLWRLRLVVANTSDHRASDRNAANARSLLGAHVVLEVADGRFVSLLEPPEDASAAASACENVRCWPVLASDADDIVLASPIILYDHPAVAPESAGALFDATEIDEILTLRVMAMTEQEKAEARATDAHAAAIIDRCDSMSAEELQRLHGAFRGPAGRGVPRGEEPSEESPHEPFEVPTWADTGGAPWWDPSVDAAVSPESDSVMIDGIIVRKGSCVRVQPRRRADAQDLFFAGREARVAAVYADVDGNHHVAVVLSDDPAAELHEWYGRFLYFAPDELEPLAAHSTPRKEG
jgi:hypothetical protein